MKQKMMIILYSIIGLIALVFAVAIFTKKDYTIVRDIKINKPDTVIFDYLRFLDNHKDFNAWFLKDPNMVETSENKDGQVGYILNYEGNKDLGAGEQELIALKPYELIDIELRFIKPFKSISRTPFELQKVGTSETIVTWTMHGKMNYPLNFGLLFIDMDKFLGKDVQKSLENLKSQIEK
jgi:hypothetical protein